MSLGSLRGKQQRGAVWLHREELEVAGPGHVGRGSVTSSCRVSASSVKDVYKWFRNLNHAQEVDQGLK